MADVPIDLYEGLVSGRFTLIDTEAETITWGDEVYLLVKARARRQLFEEKRNGKTVKLNYFEPSDVWVVERSDEHRVLDIVDARKVIPELAEAFRQTQLNPVFVREPFNRSLTLVETADEPDLEPDEDPEVFISVPHTVPVGTPTRVRDAVLAKFLQGDE